MYKRDLNQRVARPFIYKHPVTEKYTLLIDLAEKTQSTYSTSPYETQVDSNDVLQKPEELVELIKNKLEDPSRFLEYKWEEGDFAIIDNLALAHLNETVHPYLFVKPREFNRISI